MKDKEFIFILSDSFGTLVNDWENYPQELVCAVGSSPWAIDYKYFTKFSEYLKGCSSTTLVCVLYTTHKYNQFETFDICHYNVENRQFEQIANDLKRYYKDKFVLITTIQPYNHWK